MNTLVALLKKDLDVNPIQYKDNEVIVTFINGTVGIAPRSTSLDKLTDSRAYTSLDGEFPINWKHLTLLNPTQEITSQDTSINSKKLPAIFNKKLAFELFAEDSINVDLGGGKFDNVLDTYEHFTNVVIDPFNRSFDENFKGIFYLQNKGADTVTLSNVLNVLSNESDIHNVLMQAENFADVCYITVYEGDGSGIGKETSKGFQRNAKLATYKEYAKAWFDNVDIQTIGGVKFLDCYND